MNVNIQLHTLDDGQFLKMKALLDCGSTGSCINRNYVEREGVQTKRVALPIPIYRTINKEGPITEYVEIRMTIEDHVEKIQLAISNLGDTNVFIGYEWLKQHNPNIDWRKSRISFNECPEECG